MNLIAPLTVSLLLFAVWWVLEGLPQSVYHRQLAAVLPMIQEEYIHLVVAVAFGVAIGFLIPCLLDCGEDRPEEDEDNDEYVSVDCLAGRWVILMLSHRKTKSY